MGELEERRLRALPCWTSDTILSVTPAKQVQGLGCGRTNQNFVLRTKQSGAFFVRCSSDLPDFGVSRARECEIARAIGKLGIGPDVVYSQMPDIIVWRLLEGQPLTTKMLQDAMDGRDEKLLRAVATSIRRLHDCEIPVSMAESAVKNLRKWMPPHLDSWYEHAKQRGFSRRAILDDVTKLLDEIESIAGEPVDRVCLCHFDLLPDNMVYLTSSRSIALVDLEYSGVGQREMDLAIMFMGCDATHDQEMNFLMHYYNAENASTLLEPLRKRFDALKLLAAIRETLWGVVAETSESSSLNLEEAMAYTDLNYARYQTFLRRFNDCYVSNR